MKIVVSSKLYASKSVESQKKIKAAMEDPVNKELVQQLAEYVDDKYLEPQRRAEQGSAGVIHDAEAAPEDKGQGSSSRPSAPMPRGGGGHSSMSMPDDFAAIGEMDDTPEDMSSDDTSTATDDFDDATVINPEGQDDVESATDIKASTEVSALSPDEIKGSLNLSESTGGVSRVVISEAEVWIYYLDKINLNNIMNNVIEFAGSKYYNLAFNRLARSDNAIVFDIVDQSAATVETITDTDEK